MLTPSNLFSSSLISWFQKQNPKQPMKEITNKCRVATPAFPSANLTAYLKAKPEGPGRTSGNWPSGEATATSRADLHRAGAIVNEVDARKASTARERGLQGHDGRLRQASRAGRHRAKILLQITRIMLNFWSGERVQPAPLFLIH